MRFIVTVNKCFLPLSLSVSKRICVYLCKLLNFNVYEVYCAGFLSLLAAGMASNPPPSGSQVEFLTSINHMVLFLYLGNFLLKCFRKNRKGKTLGKIWTLCTGKWLFYEFGCSVLASVEWNAVANLSNYWRNTGISIVNTLRYLMMLMVLIFDWICLALGRSRYVDVEFNSILLRLELIAWDLLKLGCWIAL